MSSFSFSLSSPIATSRLGPRLGSFTLKRSEAQTISFDTPGLITATSRGVIPHLSRDHHNATSGIRWVHVPFESFLEHVPPVPTLQPGPNPLHTFLGYLPSQHILSMSVRDPFDGREMPPNGNNHISAFCIRGVRKITPQEWRSHAIACKPDFVLAMCDIPFTNPPFSQKRLTKSIERSGTWLVDILRPIDSTQGQIVDTPPRLNVLVNLAGGASIAARSAFSELLRESLYAKEADLLKPLKNLDDGVAGYVFDLVPLRLAFAAEKGTTAQEVPEADLDSGNTMVPNNSTPTIQEMVPLFEASLSPLPADKLRIANSTCSPHEILDLVQRVGIDLFDAHWAQRVADIGISLDFRFPVAGLESMTQRQPSGKRNIGHNLYDLMYARDFSRLAGCFLQGHNANDLELTCPCAACSPVSPSVHISHSVLDEGSFPSANTMQVLPGYTRAYIHHLLHTHEMSSHTLLAMHNIAVLDAFFCGIRQVLLGGGHEKFVEEAEKFKAEYDGGLAILNEARIQWSAVEKARGKGRLAREKAKQVEATLGTAVQ